jgi:sugar lactone lactonase YvrE
VLGFDFDAAGSLIAADAYRGLIEVAPDGEIRLLTDAVDGDPIRYANSVVVGTDGLVYFTDASTRFSPVEVGGTFEASIPDILEQSATGRVLAFDPTRGTTRLVARGLSFANGIALSADEAWLFVAETGRYRVWTIRPGAAQLDLAGAPPDQASVLLDNLPGYPDNLMRGGEGRIWLGFAKPRSRLVDALAAWPRLRAVTMRLPRALWPVPQPYGHVIAFSEDGRVVADLQDPTGAYPETTGLTETAERRYVQSLHAKGLGWLGQ